MPGYIYIYIYIRSFFPSEFSGLEYPMKNVSIIFACLHFKNYKNVLIFETVIGDL